MTDYSQAYGRAVRVVREGRQMSLRTVARALGLSQSQWSRVETGVSVMTVIQLEGACRVIGVQVTSVVALAQSIAAAVPATV